MSDAPAPTIADLNPVAVNFLAKALRVRVAQMAQAAQDDQAAANTAPEVRDRAQLDLMADVYKLTYEDEAADTRKEIEMRKRHARLVRSDAIADLAERAAQVNPGVLEADPRNLIIAQSKAYFDDMLAEIEAVTARDGRDAAVSALAAVEDRITSYADIMLDVLQSVEGPMEAPETPMVDMWTGDLGKAVREGLAFDYLQIPDAPVRLAIPKDVYDVFRTTGDLMTPAVMQDESQRIFEQQVEACIRRVEKLGPLREQLVKEANDIFINDEKAKDYVLRGMISAAEEVVEGLRLDAELLEQQLHRFAASQWDRAQNIGALMKGRKKRIAKSCAVPVIAVIAAGSGLALGIATSSSGVGALGGIGIALASVGLLRSSVGGLKILYDWTRSIKKLSDQLEQKIKKLEDAYQQDGGSFQEIAGTVANSIFVATTVTTLPRLKELFARLEDRCAKSSEKQIALASALDGLLDAIEGDETELKRAGATESTIDGFLKSARDSVAKLLENIQKAGKNIRDFITKYGEIKLKLEGLDALVSDDTKYWTNRIPIGVDVTFAVAGLAVGGASAATAGEAALIAWNSGVTALGAMGDAVGLADPGI